MKTFIEERLRKNRVNKKAQCDMFNAAQINERWEKNFEFCMNFPL